MTRPVPVHPFVHPPASPLHPAVAAVSPTPELVLRLQAPGTYPCVSVLLTTRPGAAMQRDDVTALRGLVAEAERRLHAEAPETVPPQRITQVLARLESLVAAAAAQAAGHAVALFADARTSALVRLPVPVTDRVVIDPTFATRDLVRALHRTPRHVVLALSGERARLFDGLGRTLEPVSDHGFPLDHDGRDGRGARRGTRSWRAGTRGRGRADRTAERRTGPDLRFLRRVDAALGAQLRTRPAPLVLVGDPRTVAAFRSVSRHLDRLAGTVEANLVTAPPSAFGPQVRRRLEDYLSARQAEALALLERRAGEHRCVSGIHAAWLAARAEHPEMLAVEEGFGYPARLSPDGDYVTPAPDVDHPQVVDDLVDELIETVLRRGGWVALVHDGSLGGHERVALTLRR